MGPQPSMTELMVGWPLDVVYEPGRVEFYSNYGYALLGAAIEKARGQRFEEYIEQQVLGPLGMNDSSFDQPLRAEMGGVAWRFTLPRWHCLLRGW